MVSAKLHQCGGSSDCYYHYVYRWINLSWNAPFESIFHFSCDIFCYIKLWAFLGYFCSSFFVAWVFVRSLFYLSICCLSPGKAIVFHISTIFLSACVIQINVCDGRRITIFAYGVFIRLSCDNSNYSLCPQ